MGNVVNRKDVFMLKQLCEILNIDVEDVERWDGKLLTLYNGEEYLVYSDYDKAYEDAVEYAKDVFEDVGIDIEHLQKFIVIRDLIDTDWFDDALRESMEFYVDDITTEWESDGRTRLYHEMVDAGIIDEIDEDEDEDISDYEKEDFIDYLVGKQGNSIDWFRFNFGERDFNDTIIERNLIDLDQLARECVDIDGVAHFLASYDGNEIEDGEYYLYRIN